MDYPGGLEPYIARQHLLYHSYSPIISVELTHNAESLVQTKLDLEQASILQVLKPYGNNAKYKAPNQVYSIRNSLLITKNYASFPVRFEASLPELVSVVNASTSRSGSTTSTSAKFSQLFSISYLEHLMKHESVIKRESDLYLHFFTKVITSNRVVSFDTFNHPISQLFIIDYHRDTYDSLRKMIVNFRNFSFPRYFQLDDLLIHAIVLYDPSQVSDITEVQKLQNHIKASLDIYSNALPVAKSQDDPQESVSILKFENSTIDEDIQRITLDENTKNDHGGMDNFFQIPKQFDSTLRLKLYEFVNKYLIPHMEKKIRNWDDQILAPKKSITGKFLSVSKKLFNNNDSSNLLSTNSSLSSFNYQENYYLKSSPEQTIRKLADWSLILKDFKYAYSTYDLIKKDYINDKAWAYVASTQEMCMVSLLLAQTQQVNQENGPDKNTIRKIRHDIIEPYLDNLSYTFKSRLGLKSYTIKSILVVIELVLCMSLTYNISSWHDLIEKNLCKCITEFDTHLTANNQKLQVIRALLYERLGFSMGRCVPFGEDIRNYIGFEPFPSSKPLDTSIEEAESDGYYKNPHKLTIERSSCVAGLTRFRKSSIWYLLSMKEWLILENVNQVRYLLQNIRFTFDIVDLTDEWYDRESLLLNYIKRTVKDAE